MEQFIGRKIILAMILALLGQGCISVPERLSAVPPSLTAKAEIPGMPGVRYVGGGDMSELAPDRARRAAAGAGVPGEAGHKGPLPPAVFLAISGRRRQRRLSRRGC